MVEHDLVFATSVDEEARAHDCAVTPGFAQLSTLNSTENCPLCGQDHSATVTIVPHREVGYVDICGSKLVFAKVNIAKHRGLAGPFPPKYRASR